MAYLASLPLGGRGAGSAGGDSAAVFIARRYEQLDLRGAFQAACRSAPPCPPSFFQFFGLDSATAQNVAVIVPGTDSAARGEYVVVGAHYDHLGSSTVGALDANLGAITRPGADDNASGTAAVLELGRRLAARPARRSVLLVHFDAEELGMVGSGVFVEHAPVPRRSMLFMVNLDMVGRLRGGGLTVDASTMTRDTRTRVNLAAAGSGLRVSFSSGAAGRSDHASFAQAGIPSLALFTGFHDDYHKASDTAARLNVPGILRVVDLAEGLVRALADEGTDSASVREVRNDFHPATH